MFSNQLYSHDYLFYACMVSKCNILFDDNFAAIAGVSYINCSYNLYINLNKFCSLELIQRLAVLKHEMLHILNGHLLYRREESRNHYNWNIASDCAINQLIDQSHLPPNCVSVEYLEELTKSKVKKLEPSEYYYELLNNSKIDMKSLEKIDKHQSWELSSTSDSIETQKNVTSEMIEESKEITQKTIGEFPNEYSKWIKINKNEQKVNWKKYLKSFIKTNTKIKTVFKPNRRLPNRMDLKGYKKDKTTNILYIIDASGSVKDSEFKILNSVLVSLCSQYNLKINAIQVDSEASEPEILTKNTELIERKRNAGTFLSAGLRKAEEHKLQYDTIIVSTDGFLSTLDVSEFVKINKNVIFLVTKGGSVSEFKNLGKQIKYIKLE